MSTLALPGNRTRHGVSTLVSVAVHAAFLAWVSSVSLRQPSTPRELIRVSLVDPGRGGNGGGAAVAGPSEVQGPPVPPAAAAPVVPAPKTSARTQPKAVRRQGRAATQPVVARDSAPSAGNAELPNSAATEGSIGSGATAVGGLGDGPGGNGGGGGNGLGFSDDEIEQYLRLVRARIEASKQYPLRARRARLEGRAAVRFLVRPDGRPDDLRLSQADHPLLGDAALQTIAAAAPFPRLPRAAGSAPLEVEVPIRFQLDKEK